MRIAAPSLLAETLRLGRQVEYPAPTHTYKNIKHKKGRKRMKR